MKRILLIEDEVNFSKFIKLELEHEAYSVDVAYDGKSGLTLALESEWDMILLDVMLPGMNGFEVCRRIRNEKKTPIMMLTARDSVMDKVSGLDSGADDYIPKPFAIEELLARIRALLRRVEPDEGMEEKLRFRDITLDLVARTANIGNRILDLTKREFDLLAVFMQNINRVLTRDVLLDRVWGFDTKVETNVVDVYVRYLRNKLSETGDESYIQTQRGIGYVMR